MKRIKVHVDRPAKRPLGSQNSVEFDPFRQSTIELQVPNFNIPEGVPPPPPPTGPNEDISIDGQGNPTIEVVQTPDPTSGGDVGDGIDIDIELPDAVLVGDRFDFKVTFDPEQYEPNTTYTFRITGLEADEIRLDQQTLGSWTFNQSTLLGTFKTDAFFPANVVSAKFLYFKDPNTPDLNREGTFTIVGEDASKTILFSKAAVESELNLNLSSNSEYTTDFDGNLFQRKVSENEVYSLTLTEPDKDRILSYEIPFTIDGNSEQEKNWFFSDVNGNPLSSNLTKFSLNRNNNYENTLYFKIASDGIGEYPSLLKFDVFNPSANATSSIKFFLREEGELTPTTGQVGYMQDSPLDYEKFSYFGDTLEFVTHIQKRITTRVPASATVPTTGEPLYDVLGVSVAIDADSPNNSSGITNAEQGGINSLREGVHYDYVNDEGNVIPKPDLVFTEENDYSVSTKIRLRTPDEVGELCDNVVFLRILRGLDPNDTIVPFTPGYNVPYRRVKNTIQKVQYDNIWTPNELGSELKAWYRPESIPLKSDGWSNSVSVTGLFDMENSSGSSLPIKLINFAFPNEVSSNTWFLDPKTAPNQTNEGGGPFTGQFFTIDTELINPSDNPFAIPTDVAVFNVSLSPFSVDYFNPTLVNPLILAQADAPENSFPGELQWNLSHTLLSVGDFKDDSLFPTYQITDMSMYGNVPISNYPGSAYTGVRIRAEDQTNSGETFVVEQNYGGGLGGFGGKGIFTSCPMTVPQANPAIHSLIFRKNILSETGLPSDTTSYPDPTIWGRGNGQTVVNYPTPELNNIDRNMNFGRSVNQVEVFRQKLGPDYKYGAGMIPEIIVVQANNIDEETGGVISDDTIFKIEGYLAHKYNTYPLLPKTHPYKNTPPLLGD